MPERRIVIGVLSKALHGLSHVVETDGIGVTHWAAPMEREPVARQVHHVDVARAARDAFLKNLGRLVDEGENQTLDNLFVADLAGGAADARPIIHNHLLDQCRWDCVAFTRLVVIPAGACFLTKTAHFAEPVRGQAVAHIGPFNRAALADRPADVVTCEVAHAERTHRKAKLLNRLVDL